jgi:hypothetical protein
VTLAFGLEDRPEEEFALFNPAFVVRLLHEAARQHQPVRKESLPLPYAYLIPPLVLHGPTRRALPLTVSSQMASWAQDHPALLGDLAERASALVPIVGEACCFGLRHGVLLFDEAGFLAGQLRRRPRGLETTPEVSECISRAGFMGRWLAGQPDVATVYSMWGLRP